MDHLDIEMDVENENFVTIPEPQKCMFCRRKSYCNIYDTVNEDGNIIYPHKDVIGVFSEKIETYLHSNLYICYECLILFRLIRAVTGVMYNTFISFIEGKFDDGKPVLAAFQEFKKHIPEIKHVHEDDIYNYDSVENLMESMYSVDYNKSEAGFNNRKKKRRKPKCYHWSHKKGSVKSLSLSKMYSSNNDSRPSSAMSRSSFGTTFSGFSQGSRKSYKSTKSNKSTRSTKSRTPVTPYQTIPQYDENGVLLNRLTRSISSKRDIEAAELAKKDELTIEYPCIIDFCLRNFENGDDLTKHTFEDHAMNAEPDWENYSKNLEALNVKNKDELKYPCLLKTCFVICRDEDEIIKHKEKSHHLAPFYECRECYKKKFTTKEELISHTNLKHDKVPTICFWCPTMCKNSKELQNHLKEHRSHQHRCNRCNKLCKTEKMLQEHTKSVHFNIEQRISVVEPIASVAQETPIDFVRVLIQNNVRQQENIDEISPENEIALLTEFFNPGKDHVAYEFQKIYETTSNELVNKILEIDSDESLEMPDLLEQNMVDDKNIDLLEMSETYISNLELLNDTTGISDKQNFPTIDLENSLHTFSIVSKDSNMKPKILQSIELPSKTVYKPINQNEGSIATENEISTVGLVDIGIVQELDLELRTNVGTPIIKEVETVSDPTDPKTIIMDNVATPISTDIVPISIPEERNICTDAGTILTNQSIQEYQTTPIVEDAEIVFEESADVSKSVEARDNFDSLVLEEINGEFAQNVKTIIENGPIIESQTIEKENSELCAINDVQVLNNEVIAGVGEESNLIDETPIVVETNAIENVEVCIEDIGINTKIDLERDDVTTPISQKSEETCMIGEDTMDAIRKSIAVQDMEDIEVIFDNISSLSEAVTVPTSQEENCSVNLNPPNNVIIAPIEVKTRAFSSVLEETAPKKSPEKEIILPKTRRQLSRYALVKNIQLVKKQQISKIISKNRKRGRPFKIAASSQGLKFESEIVPQNLEAKKLANSEGPSLTLKHVQLLDKDVEKKIEMVPQNKEDNKIKIASSEGSSLSSEHVRLLENDEKQKKSLPQNKEDKKNQIASSLSLKHVQLLKINDKKDEIVENIARSGFNIEEATDLCNDVPSLSINPKDKLKELKVEIEKLNLEYLKDDFEGVYNLEQNTFYTRKLRIGKNSNECEDKFENFRSDGVTENQDATKGVKRTRKKNIVYQESQFEEFLRSRLEDSVVNTPISENKLVVAEYGNRIEDISVQEEPVQEINPKKRGNKRGNSAGKVQADSKSDFDEIDDSKEIMRNKKKTKEKVETITREEDIQTAPESVDIDEDKAADVQEGSVNIIKRKNRRRNTILQTTDQSIAIFDEKFDTQLTKGRRKVKEKQTMEEQEAMQEIVPEIIVSKRASRRKNTFSKLSVHEDECLTNAYTNNESPAISSSDEIFETEKLIKPESTKGKKIVNWEANTILENVENIILTSRNCTVTKVEDMVVPEVNVKPKLTNGKKTIKDKEERNQEENFEANFNKRLNRRTNTAIVPLIIEKDLSADNKNTEKLLVQKCEDIYNNTIEEMGKPETSHNKVKGFKEEAIIQDDIEKQARIAIRRKSRAELEETEKRLIDKYQKSADEETFPFKYSRKRRSMMDCMPNRRKANNHEICLNDNMFHKKMEKLPCENEEVGISEDYCAGPKNKSHLKRDRLSSPNNITAEISQYNKASTISTVKTPQESVSRKKKSRSVPKKYEAPRNATANLNDLVIESADNISKNNLVESVSSIPAKKPKKVVTIKELRITPPIKKPKSIFDDPAAYIDETTEENVSKKRLGVSNVVSKVISVTTGKNVPKSNTPVHMLEETFNYKSTKLTKKKSKKGSTPKPCTSTSRFDGR